MSKEQTMLSSGLFEVDTDGAVWRVAKRQGRGVMKGGGYHTGAKVVPCTKVRAEYRQRQGYLLVALTMEGVKYVTGAHRLVWTHLNGPIPDGMEVNHRNGIKGDNRPENLELTTGSENRVHALEVLGARRHRPTGSSHPKTHLVEADVLEIRQMRASGVMVKDIATKYEMKPKAVSAICNRRTWKHI